MTTINPTVPNSIQTESTDRFYEASNTEALGVLMFSLRIVDGGQYIATDTFTDVFGAGNSVGEAYRDLRISLHDYRDSLAEHRDALSPRLREHLERLETLAL